MMSLMTWDPPSSHDMMLGLTFGGVAAALVGATVGALLLTPVAVAARRK